MRFEEALKRDGPTRSGRCSTSRCATREAAGTHRRPRRNDTARRAISRASTISQPQLKAAEEHLPKREPLVAHLAIAFAEPPPDDVKLVVDDRIVPLASADDITVDPGVRTIVVTAPGRVPYETKVDVHKTERKAIAVPELGYPVVFKSQRPTVGKVLTAVGIATFALGEGFGFKARCDYRGQFEGTSMPDCVDAKPDPKCNPDGYRITHSAQPLGNVGTGLVIAGGVVTAVGLYVWFFGPKELSASDASRSCPRSRLTPQASWLSAGSERRCAGLCGGCSSHRARGGRTRRARGIEPAARAGAEAVRRGAAAARRAQGRGRRVREVPRGNRLRPERRRQHAEPRAVQRAARQVPERAVLVPQGASPRQREQRAR